MADILMPKATAVWLIDNTTLTFDQIADLCGLHHLEVKGIADGDVAENMRGVDPISGGELPREEIQKGEFERGFVQMAVMEMARSEKNLISETMTSPSSSIPA